MTGPAASPDLTAAPSLAEAVRRASGRVRAHRAGRAALTTTFAVVAVLGGLILWQFAAPHAGLPLLPFGPFALALGLLLLFGTGATAFAFLRPVSVDGIARELDRRLDLGDRAATAVAVLRGEVASPLAERVVEDADATLRVALPGVRDAFPARPALSTLRGLKRLTILTFVVLIGAWIAGELPVGAPFSLGVLGSGSGPDGPLEPDVAGSTGTPGAAAPDGKGDVDADATPDPDRHEPGASTLPPDQERPREDEPAAPGVHVVADTQFDRIRATEPVIVIVSGFPTADLDGPTTYDLELSIDGRPIPTGRTLRIDPERVGGDAQALDLRRLPDAASALSPGEHTLTATARPRGGGAAATSAPVTFHLLGPDGDGSGGDGASSSSGATAGEPQPAPDEPDDGPTGPPPEAPDDPVPPDDPTAGSPPPGSNDPGGEDPTSGAPTPEFDVDFEEKLVIPLFGDGATVKKHGKRLVMVPGEGERPSEPVPLERALPAAVRRAEAAVDRARIDDRDRELVRRYFERLATWLE